MPAVGGTSNKKSYASSMARERTQKLHEIEKELPAFCREFFVGIEPRTSVLTRLGYAYDLRLFFLYILEHAANIEASDMHELELTDLDKLEPFDVEMFLEHLTYYEKDGHEFENHARGKARKLSAIRSLYLYFYKKKKIEHNMGAFLDMPKISEKPIVRLQPDEVARLLDTVESAETLTDTQKRYHQHTRLRDLALLSVFLGTGIRISECVGLNRQDINFAEGSLLITRKGGKQAEVYFGSEVEKALKDYLVERNAIDALPGHEDALFLSLQKKRMSTRVVQDMVKKYARPVSPLKKISPHKLRSTYGTTLYQETGDIYLVADVLGHKDVNTTRRHYAAMQEENRRRAAKVVRLRDDSVPFSDADNEEQ